METGDHLLRTTPIYAPAASEELLAGAQLLRRAFLGAPARSALRDAVIVQADAKEPPALLIQRGLAYRSFTLPDGRRSIVDLLLPMDIVGLDQAVMGAADHEIVAANAVSYRALSMAQVRELLRDPRIALRALALDAEERRRADRHLMEIIRLDARGRLAAMILGVYDRLRRASLVARPTFDLPLTQDQIADHLGITMVHVSRTLRRMREEKMVIVDRHVVMILDLDRLRDAAAGVSSFAQLEPVKQRAGEAATEPSSKTPAADASGDAGWWRR